MPVGPNGPVPRISVIVPVYNVADYIGACIESLRAQSFTDFEVIIVDDGSTDASLGAVWRAIGTDPRFRVISRRNGGLSAARNTGLEQARGDFISFIDSDDRVAPAFLSTLLEAIETTGADWTACAVRFCNVDGSWRDHSTIHDLPYPAFETSRPHVFDFREWPEVIRHFPSAWNKLYRRQLIDGLRFVEGLYYEDHPFFNAAARRTTGLAYVSSPLYWQTQGRAGQITREGTDRVFEQIAVLDHIDRIMQHSDRPGADTAMASIASRLVFERSNAIKDPDRRSRFARACRDYFRGRGLAYVPDRKAGVGPLWGTMIERRVPLSVIIVAAEVDASLEKTLEGLRRLNRLDFEVLLVQQGDAALTHCAFLTAAAKQHRCSVLTQLSEDPVDAQLRGLRAATGDFVVFLTPGDTVRDARGIRTALEMLTLGGADMWSAAPSDFTPSGAPPCPTAFYRRRYLLSGSEPVTAPPPSSAPGDSK